MEVLLSSLITPWDDIRKTWPKKFGEQERFIFEKIQAGDRIFVGTGCRLNSFFLGENIRNAVNRARPITLPYFSQTYLT